MASKNPYSKFKVRKCDHPGSHPGDIENEPDWSSSGHEHYVGYKNARRRRPGYVEEDATESNIDLKKALDESRETKQRAEKGDLVSWQDAIKSEKDIALYYPKGHPWGWRYVLDYTEDGIKNQQEWPINIKKREKQKQQEQEQEQEKKQQDQSQSNQSQGNQTQAEQNRDSQERQEGPMQEMDKQDQSEQQSDGQAQERSGNDTDTSNDNGSNEADERNEDQKLKAKYSSRELNFLRAIQHEKEHMANLKHNDGTGRANVTNRTSIAIDEADQFTPDNWIPRSSDLIRLTGKHPLNAEPDLTNLYSKGFITPNEFFYVRSHGAVPRLLWEFHKLEISCGNKHRSFSMKEIHENFDVINIPVTVGCDNGRRKELNMFKRTKGFNWGPGAVGCAYWRGPLMRDVLLAAGVPKQMPDQSTKRYWVQLQGADNPGEANYETSIPFEYVMDETNDVILAYEMNDDPLPPDHGYPLRVIVPGYVGGRQVKWLQKIWIDDKENSSYYHIWDNRAPPSFVTDIESEIAQEMFHHPDTALYEQYLNSIITIPRQNEKLPLKDVKKGKDFRIEGFAFNGQGNEVKRIEVTLNGGKDWLYCIRSYPEAPIRHGKKFWTWVFWHVDVDIGDLIAADAIRVRAWDVRMVTQPEEPTWNILGSMNNVQYVVKPELVNDDEPHILFRHPVVPGNGQGGWMKESAQNQISDASKNTDAPNKQFTRAEVEKHDTEGDCWIVVDNCVYDATSVLSWHPGGAAPIMMHAGVVHHDTTEEFSSLHDDYAYERLNECILGVVTDKTKKLIVKDKEEKEKNAGGEQPPGQALQKHLWVPATLKNREWVTKDTAVYTFELPKNTTSLGLGTCQHIEFGFHLRDRMLIRPYTPTKPVFPRYADVDTGDESLHDGSGEFQLTVKTYFPDSEQPGGALSNIFASMSIGEWIEMRGPTGSVIYNGRGKYTVNGKNMTFNKVSLVVGGTGLTPAYSLVARIVLDPNDETEIRMIDANNSENDILLQEDLQNLVDISQGQLQITHILAHPSEEWKGEKGLVNKDLMQSKLFPPSKESVTLLCGPPPMIEKAVVPGLQEWGYNGDKNMFGL